MLLNFFKKFIDSIFNLTLIYDFFWFILKKKNIC